MSSTDGNNWSLDLIVRGGEPMTTVSVRGRGEGEDSLELVGTIGDDLRPGVLQPVTIKLSADDVARIGMSGLEDGEIALSADGEQINTRIRAFSATSVVDERYVIYAGTLDKVDGTVDFIAVTDPIPVILLGGAVLVAGCAALSGLERIATRKEARNSGFMEECRARGGSPVVTVEIGLRLNPFKRDFGCNIRTKMECRGLGGDTMSVDANPVPLDE
jgi:hypothetical protein